MADVGAAAAPPKADVAQVKAELRELRSRHARLFKIFSANFPVSFAFTFEPSDPNFPFDIDGVRLRFTLPVGYPQEVCEVKAEEASFPSPLCEKITRGLNDQARTMHKKGQTVVLQLLQWLDQRGLATLLMDSEFIASTYLSQGVDGLSQRRYILLDPASYTAKQQPHESSSTQSEPAHSEKDESKEEEEEEDAEKEISEDRGESQPTLQSLQTRDSGSADAAPAQTPKSIEVQCSGLTLTNIGVLECITLSIVVNCYRCSKQNETTVVPGRTKSLECKNCRMALSLSLQALPLHQASSLLGLLEAHACTPLDALPSGFAGLCFECGERNVFSNVAYDRTAERTCIKCHNRIAFAIHHLTFVKKKKPPPPGLAPAKPKTKSVKIPGLKVGEPLPQKGACKHYTHSYRWLRFPCCGRAFPCDDCHNETVDHEAKWAGKMICGYCSTEQRCDEACSHCGKKVAGKGKIKDPTKMNRKDDRKYAGTCKTHSRKSERVGPKKG